MLLYDHARTEKIVERLRTAERIVRFITIALSLALCAFIGISAGANTHSTEGLVIGGAIGAIIGFILGSLSMILLSAIVEWMCQILIALGEVIESSKRASK
jgi:uncharacterized membrane protein